jgi:hypothetical protein
MNSRKIISIILVVMMLMLICSCSNHKSFYSASNSSSSSDSSVNKTENHSHSFGDWVITKNPTLKQSGVKERTCSCGYKETAEIFAKFDELSEFVSNNAYDYSGGSYTVRENVEKFGSGCRLIYPGYTVEGGGWDISLTYSPTTHDTIFLISYGFVGSQLETFAFSVEDGVVVDRYEYLFQHQNFKASFTDQISGSFSVSNLNSIDMLNYTYASKESGRSFEAFVNGYQQNACAYAKQLAIFFDAYFEYKGLSIRMSDFGFK